MVNNEELLKETDCSPVYVRVENFALDLTHKKFVALISFIITFKDVHNPEQVDMK